MKSILKMFAILAGLFLLSYCTGDKGKNNENNQEAVADTGMSDQQLADRGAYLVTIGGCHDCHSPKKMGTQGPEVDENIMLSGYQANRPILKANKAALNEGWALMTLDLTHSVGPWGASFSANLTSDPTGIGNWTEDQFKKALTEGKYKGMEGGRMLLPPMPWQNFVKMEDEDIKSIFAFLKSTKPIQNIVPPPIPPDAL
jgi:hypothetical protein